MFRRFVEVRTQFEGVHRWPDAPEEVSFLRYAHRHMFHVKLEIGVNHYDREIEFILVKRWLDKELRVGEMYLDLGTRSCEQIAARLIEEACDEYGNRRMTCTVSEDGENGARVEYTPD